MLATNITAADARLQRAKQPLDGLSVGAAIHRELWVPAEDLEEFNQHIVGLIEVTQSFGAL